MPTQSEALPAMLEAIVARRESGYTQEDVWELACETWHHLSGGAFQPYAFGRCINCGRVTVGSSAYQWAVLERASCPRRDEPWSASKLPRSTVTNDPRKPRRTDRRP